MIELTSRGEQPSRAVFAAGDAESKPLCEAVFAADQFWAVAASGTNVRFRLLWGTRASKTLVGVLSPLVAYLPGRVSLQASLIDLSVGGEAISTLTQSGSGESCVRTVATAAGPLPGTAARVTAYAAAIVTVAAVPVSIAPGDSIDIAASAELTAGGPLLVCHRI